MTLRCAVQTRDFCTCRKTSPFEDTAKTHFLLYYPTYVELCDKITSKDGTAFTKMQFEYPSNIMDGKFDVLDLRTRLKRIYEKLEDQWQKGWLQESVEQIRLDTTPYSNLKSQHEQITLSNGFEGVLDSYEQLSRSCDSPGADCVASLSLQGGSNSNWRTTTLLCGENSHLDTQWALLPTSSVLFHRQGCCDLWADSHKLGGRTLQSPDDVSPRLPGGSPANEVRHATYVKLVAVLPSRVSLW